MTTNGFMTRFVKYLCSIVALIVITTSDNQIEKVIWLCTMLITTQLDCICRSIEGNKRKEQ